MIQTHVTFILGLTMMAVTNVISNAAENVAVDIGEILSLLTTYSFNWTDLSESQKNQLLSVEAERQCEDRACVRKGYRCYIESWLQNAKNLTSSFFDHTIDGVKPDIEQACPYKFDGHVCWPAQLPGQRTFISCSQAIPNEIFQQCQRLLRKFKYANSARLFLSFLQ